MKRLITVLIVLMFVFTGFAEDAVYNDVIVDNLIIRETIEGVWGNWEITDTGDLIIDSVTTTVLNQPLDLTQASITVTGLADIGTTLAVAGISTLTGAVDCAVALTCGTIVAGTSIESGTTITAGTSLAVTTDAVIAGDISGVDSCFVTDLDVSVNAIVDGTLTSATYNFADATAVAGTKNAITIDFVPDLTVTIGTKITYISEFLNDAVTTINVDGAGVVNIYDSADVGACSGGEIVDTMIVELVWDGTQYQLTNTAL